MFAFQTHPKAAVGATACCLFLALYHGSSFVTQTPHILRAPSHQDMEDTDNNEGGSKSRPYSPNSLPGGRYVKTPYGVIRVYEWGPKTGHRVLLLCGVSTPAAVLSDLADALVEKGCRVMLFDYFGRGYSDAPNKIRHNTALYITQILLVLSSSEIPWTGFRSFSIIGYSFGGALGMALAEHFPNLIKSITLVAPSGLVRQHHVSWVARLVYKDGWLPVSLRRELVRRRLHIPPPLASKAGQNTTTASFGSSDATGGPSYDYAVISERCPNVNVADVLNWQLTNHPGFVDAFISCMNYAPIFEQRDTWTSVGNTFRERRREHSDDAKEARVLLILGASDPSIVEDELIQDATATLGKDGIKVEVLDGGHEIAITHGYQIADIFFSNLTTQIK